MIQQKKDDDKKIEDILEEINKVLDLITSAKRDIDKDVKEDIIYNNLLLNKGAETTQSLVEEKSDILHQEEDKSDKDLSDKNKKSEIKSANDLKEEKQINKFTDIKPELENKLVEDAQEQLEESNQISKIDSTDKEGIIEIKIALFYPDIMNDIKDKFIENLNSALKKFCKKPIKVVLSLSKNYNSLEKDILLQVNQILEEIKINAVEALFLIVKELSSLEEDFIKKLSDYVLVSKFISYKDLDLKSTYLDISIDILLITR